MNKKHFAKFKIKDKVLKHELVRAHSVIILLVVALMTMLVVSTVPGFDLDPTLAFATVLLLGIVGVLSLSVVVALIRWKK